VEHSQDAKQSLREGRLPGVERFAVEACFRSERRSLSEAAYSQDAAHSPSPVQPVDGAHRCALLECYAPRCQVEERCSPAEQVAFRLGAELPHSCLQVYKVLLLVWLAHRH
jgi:hypothetical protein